jgi:hypothetical protein
MLQEYCSYLLKLKVLSKYSNDALGILKLVIVITFNALPLILMHYYVEYLY